MSIRKRVWVHALHPANGIVCLATGFYLIEGETLRTISLESCRTSHEAVLRTINSVHQRAIAERFAVDIFVCHKSAVCSTVKNDLQPLGNTIQWIPRAEMSSGLLKAFSEFESNLGCSTNKNQRLAPQKREKSMSLVVSSTPKKKYAVADEGEHLAVIADVIDIGEVETDRGPKARVRFVWITDQSDENGRPITTMMQFNKTLHENSLLRKTVKSILGKDPGETYDLETLIGRTNRIVIEHSEHEGVTYGNITAILKSAEKVEIPKDYMRAKDRKAKKTASPSNNGVPRAIIPPAQPSEFDAEPF